MGDWDYLQTLGQLAGGVGGFVLGGPAGAKLGWDIGGGVGDMLDGNTGGSPNQTQTQTDIAYKDIESDMKTREAQARADITSGMDAVQQAYADLRDITSPAFQKASGLFGQARETIQPFTTGGTAQKTYADILSGDIDITQLPQYQASSAALRRALAATGETQSASSVAGAYTPLIAQIMGQFQREALAERQREQQAAGTLASLFQTEAQLPLKELGITTELTTRPAERISKLLQAKGQTAQSFASLLGELGIKKEEIERGIQEKEDKAMADLYSGVMELGFENKDDIIKAIGDLADRFTGGGDRFTGGGYDFTGGGDYFIGGGDDFIGVPDQIIDYGGSLA